ncbi:hypothetical protein LEP1GSC038_2757 [Leptospira weilii str. 2006001855]|uniref:Uncharacterized protein n=2 Tax=Leptospira weilii TaxID=28184 RepID=M6FL85_9LEPT|nr:hypothetical protein LEP1GSC038_2757 [Leptospira weilii str. 2006001855]
MVSSGSLGIAGFVCNVVERFCVNSLMGMFLNREPSVVYPVTGCFVFCLFDFCDLFFLAMWQTKTQF